MIPECYEVCLLMVTNESLHDAVVVTKIRGLLIDGDH